MSGPERDDLLWLIWSNEHLAWWRPFERGYTTLTHEAGRYDEATAQRICEAANRGCPDTHIPNEVRVLAPPIAPTREAFAVASGMCR